MKTDESLDGKQEGLQIEIVGLFAALKESFWLTLLCTVATVLAANYYISKTPKVYASRAIVEVSRGEIGMAAFQNVNSADAASFDTLKTLELTIASQSVLMEALRTLHLADDPIFAPKRAAGPYTEAELVERLSAHVRVNLIRGTRLIELVAEEQSPERAQKLAQTILDQFFEQSANRRHQLSSTVRESLMAEAERVSKSMESAEQRMEEYQEKYNAVSLTDRQNIVVERLLSANQQMAAAKADRLAIEAAYLDIQHFRDTDILRLEEIESVAALPSVAEAKRVFLAQETEIATLRKRYGPHHPRMIEAETRRDELFAALKKELSAAADLLTRSYEAAKTKQIALEKALAEQEKAAFELDKIAIPYRAIEREVESTRLAYQQIQERLKETGMNTLIEGERERDFGNIRVVEQPLISLRPVRPAPKKLYAIAVSAGLFSGCCLILIGRAFDTTLRSVDDAEKIIGLPVLAAIPFLRQRHKKRPMLDKNESFSAEAFRSLRTSLNLLGKESGLKSVLFVSALPGEGKSYCSLHYAMSLTHQGFKTLIIDCDLRRPKMSVQAECDAGPDSLSRCIRDPALFDSVVKKTSFDHLFLLANVQPTHEAQELLSSPGLAEVLKRANKDFDRVVIDTAPIVAVSDALPIASLVSAVCLVVRAEHTPRRVVRRARRLLEEIAKRSPVGIILNRARVGKRGQPYYSNYSSEYAMRPAGAGLMKNDE